MATTLSEARAPRRESRQNNKQNVFYPQARVTLSVVFENFGDPDAPRVIPVTPKSIQVFSNSYKEADTWSIEFDAKDLPVTPELIRAGSCEIYLFQAPIGELPEVVRGRALDAAFDDEGGVIEGLEPTVVGLFDEVSLDMGDNGSTVSIEGMDYTSLFLAKQWDPRKSGNGRGRIPKGQLVNVLRKLKGQVESADAMQLVVEGDPSDPAIKTQPIVGAAESRANKRGIPVKNGSNYWDVMYGLAVRYGYILFVRGLKIVLTTPQAYVAGKSKSRKMVWGRNLLSLRTSRRIGQVQVPVIQVSSYDPKTRKTIVAEYPKNKKQQPVTGLGTKRKEVQVYSVPGIRSKSRLRAVAESVYNLKARSEQSMEMETRDLRDTEGTDLIELRAGDAVNIGFDTFNKDGVILEGQTVSQRVSTLERLGYTTQVAKDIANSMDRTNLFKRPFRVREVTIDYDNETGISISAELQNFVNIADQGTGTTRE